MAAAAAAESQLAEPFPHPLATKCRDVRTDFAKIGRIGEGTYGKVYKARDKMTGEVVALKRIFLLNEKSEGFPLAGLREITSLRALRHPNIVDLRDVALGPKGDVFLVCEFCDNDLMVMAEHRDEPFTEAQVKCILVQLLRAVQHVHDRGYVHRDIKMSNLLYRNGRVKLGDFGLARPCPPGSGRYSSRVVTLWFRAPELLLGSTTYGSALDMWSVGCVAAELLLGRPLFPAAVEHDAVVLISRLLGPPSPDRFPEVERLPSPPQAAITEGAAAIRRALVSACLHGRPLPVPPHPRSPAAAHASPPDAFEAVFPRLCPEGLDFLRRLLAYSPARRLSAAEALAHPYLTTVAPPPADPAHMPFCRDQISIDAEEAARGRRRRVVKPGPAADPTDLDPGRKPAALIATSASRAP
ncbi:hypothetical protein FNF31_03782 [Cafeteria roenbergensis]|uniref:Cyclin-dependent kinase 2 homolog n=1 Tax=Cafeteria roenbergensis TaxID=33653 RepID=A0A5A8D9F9_CAFRO|nr:hypothetical protein FNF31_03782 [Cafeteria roenbergensis]